MKINVRLVLLVLLMGALPVQAADLFLSIKTGVFDLQESRFNSSVYGPLVIDTESNSSSAIGMEWLLRDKWMVGFELYKMQHDWKGVVETGQMDTRMAVFTGKRLFNPNSVVQPYIGAGLGLIYLDFNTGDSWENEGTVAGHLGGGVLVKFDSVAAYVEMRHFENLSTTSDYEFVGSSMYGGLRFAF
jgi:outer membrane protein W